MSIKCTHCGRDHDATLFEFNRSITCVCGKTVDFRHEQIKDRVFREKKIEEEDKGEEE